MYFALFSPTLVLLIWALVVAWDGWLGNGWMILFLILLAFAAGGAEGVRTYLRHVNHQIKKEQREHDRRRV